MIEFGTENWMRRCIMGQWINVAWVWRRTKPCKRNGMVPKGGSCLGDGICPISVYISTLHFIYIWTASTLVSLFFCLFYDCLFFFLIKTTCNNINNAIDCMRIHNIIYIVNNFPWFDCRDNCMTLIIYTVFWVCVDWII